MKPNLLMFRFNTVRVVTKQSIRFPDASFHSSVHCAEVVNVGGLTGEEQAWGAAGVRQGSAKHVTRRGVRSERHSVETVRAARQRIREPVCSGN